MTNQLSSYGRILVLTVSLALLSSSVRADDDIARESLRGINSFAVLVGEPDPITKDLGLSALEIQTAVEVKLRLAGVKIVSLRDRLALPGAPYLFLNLTAAGKVPGIVGYDLDLSFEQSVSLSREPTNKLHASTWRTGQMGIQGSVGAATGIKETIAGLVDEFINAYLSVNPK